MATVNDLATGDLLNEGWTYAGAGVTKLYQAWSALADDSKYAKCPATKGRGRLSFYDESAIDVPNGAVITSVTIKVRAESTDSTARTLTVQMMCSDDSSRYTSRTIPLTTSPTTVEVGTYTKDALGKAWTIDRIYRLRAQLFTYSGTAADKVRVYEFYAVVNYSPRPTVKVNNPTGTVDSSAPYVDWTYSQADGDHLTSSAWKVFTAAQQEVRTFNPSNATPYKSGSKAGDVTSFYLPSLAPNTYYLYVQATSSKKAVSAWTGRAFTLKGSAPGAPGGSFGGVGTGGGGGFESVVADSVTSNAYVTLRDGSNLLSMQQGDFETPTDSLGYVGTNATLAQDTSAFYNTGGGSMSVTASSAANMAATSQFTAIAELAPVTGRAQFLAAVTGRTVGLEIRFYDDAFVEVAASVLSGTGTDVTGTWTEVTATGSAPLGARYATVGLLVSGPANAEMHRVDAVGLMYGTNSAWSNGGHGSRNLLSAGASDANDPITTEPWATDTTASVYARAAATGVGSDSPKAFGLTYQGVTPTVSYISTGTAYTDNTFATGYTLNRPASGADGDLLVAYVSSSVGGRATPPDGWVVVDYIEEPNVPTEVGLTVMMRDGLAADPATWVGDFSNVTACKRATVVRYRGAADTTMQFDAEQMRLGGTTLNPTTAAVTNSNAGAWRLSAFAVRDGVAGGTAVANIIAPTAPPIQYVGKAGAWIYNSATTTTGFTVNRPSGVISGDLMVATLAVSGVVATVTPPAGWTLVRRTQKTYGNGDKHSGSMTMAVMKRTAGASEPASWSGTHTSGFTPKITQCSAYRNADLASAQFIAENSSTGTGTTMTTATVTNTSSNAWRIVSFGNATQVGTSFTSNESSERSDYHTSLTDYPDLTLGMYDSNGPVSTGSQVRVGYSSDDPWTCITWIGILKPSGSVPGAGTNESERQDATAGVASPPWLTLAVYDSNGVAAQGEQSVTAQFTPGSGSAVDQTVTWLGFLKPIAPTIEGDMGANTVAYVDISHVSKSVTARAGGKMSVLGSFLGSVAGVPYLKLYCYVGTHLIDTQTAVGVSYNDTTWVPSSAVFDILPGTTRVKIGLFTTDRQIGDVLYFDRMSVGFGPDAIYRSGTGRTAHPVFSRPIIDYAEDLGTGYGDWASLPGQDKALLKFDQLTGLCTFVDQTIVPLSSRKYRARTRSYGLLGESYTSEYGPDSDEVQLEADEWWLKDLVDQTNSVKLKVKADPLSVLTVNTDSTFQPLGRDLPVVLTEGYKGDTIPITVEVDRFQYRKLIQTLTSGHALYLQSNMDNAWWVRPVGDLPSETMLSGQMWTNPLRYVKLSFQQVDMEQ